MLSDTVKLTIQSAYSEYLSNRDLNPRHGQKHMLAQVARTLGSIELDAEGKKRPDQYSIAVIEAGTGTGKTVGYALSAIAVAMALGKKLVISTATIALQEQVVNKDLPDILDNTGLKFKAVLAKGRGRYLCTHKLEQLIQFYSGTVVAMSLFEETMEADEATLAQFNDFMAQFGSGAWSGDRDHWPDKIDDKVWFSLTSSHRECLNRRCPHYQNCPFFEARGELENADVIIANHDLVMADLSLGGGAILPAPEDTIYVFDEGHHLPDKALSHFAQQLTVKYTLNQLDSIRKQIPKVRLELEYGDTAERLMDNIIESLNACHQQLALTWSSLQPWFNRLSADEKTLTFLQPEQRLPIDELLSPLEQPFNVLFTSVSALDENTRKHLSSSEDPQEKDRLQNALPVIGRWLSRIEPAKDLVSSWLQPDKDNAPPAARWMDRIDSAEVQDLVLNTSPVSASPVLRGYLWNRCCGAVVTSATLTVAGKFDRLLTQTGISEGADLLKVESPFDYPNLVVAKIPDIAVDGSKRDSHTESIAELIRRHLPKESGNLVLFSSRAQMQDVYELLEDDWKALITLQDDLPKTALIEHHKERLEEGGGSTLFGLASLAEGVDLPGNYLKHLVIAKIPFGVPDDPIASTLSRWLESRGMNPFQIITLPAATIRMVQACGRLVRQEQDSGTIWFMDRRIVEKRYGKTIIDSLPAYRWEVT
ncbi:ATP-dependent DNA helicase DinG [Reinekea marinisedimentorum]|uniref:ATP-dependent DNA helicase DinG n=1 Tax=Reinekea marinisedimentorum TaxID=230495 RepID=A0A4R3I9M2_9GAMM|nr:ATP-dependent DNA helicase DinG [Reinekea marinisedimentorum]TCS42578.1 ATP-dependent DNA helicase DinG [Reinekea marinisedimentorum]